jgi:hypothetical protein
MSGPVGAVEAALPFVQSFMERRGFTLQGKEAEALIGYVLNAAALGDATRVERDQPANLVIPDEAVEAAASVIREIHYPDYTPDPAFARRVLEASAPHMKAQALCDALEDLEDVDPDDIREWLRDRAEAVRPAP